MQSSFRNWRPARSWRMAVDHGYRHPLLWHTPGTAMLVPYAHLSIYLNVVSLYGRRRSYRVQVGRREWCRPLQRSTARECREGAVESAADLFCSQDSSACAASSPTGGFKVRSRLSDLRRLRAGKRPGVHEHIDGHRWCADSTRGSARRHCDRDTRRTARPGCPGQRRSVHDLTRGQRHALDSDDGSGSVGRDGLFVGRRDLPCASTIGAITDSTHPTTLTAPRDALRRGTRRSRGRRGI